MIVKMKSAEVNLGAATTVSNANVVRVYNSNSSTDFEITNSNGNSMTLPAGAISFIDKLPTETLTAGNTDVLAVSVAYNIA